jgi:multidrug efflux pump subunit AcrA (membrane-fusion protein)
MKLILPIIILCICIPMAYKFANSGKEAPKRERRAKTLKVEAKPLLKQSTTTTIVTHGRIKPKNQLNLSFGVQGRVTMVSDLFEKGTKVKKGQILAKIESEEIEMLVAQSNSKIADIEQKIEIEQAAMEKDMREWKTALSLNKMSNKDAKPSRLRSHEPQLNSLSKALVSAKSELKWRKIQISKCNLVVPFDGIITERNISVGTTVQGTFVTGKVVSLKFQLECPLTENDQSLISRTGFPNTPLDITVNSTISDDTIKGKLLRYSVSVDSRAQLATAIAEFDLSKNSFPKLLVNQFVKANISGPSFHNKYVLDEAFYTPGKGILMITSANVLSWREPKIQTHTNKILIIDGDEPTLSDNLHLCLTPLQSAVEGTKVDIYSPKNRKNKK